jgi:DNA-directed RNA polymerase subunit beta
MVKKLVYKLQKYLRSNQQTCINHRPIVWKGEKIKSGQVLTDGPAISSNELALGQNVLDTCHGKVIISKMQF